MKSKYHLITILVLLLHACKQPTINSSNELDDSLAIFYFNKALEIEPESLEVKLMLQNIQTEKE